MNREILYRGKSTEENAWIEGFYKEDLDCGVVKPYIYSCPEAREIDKKTISQFTGLLDKKGVKIFEGDILEYNTIKHYTQQSFEELPPEIDEWYLSKVRSQVVFKSGMFVLGDLDDCHFNVPIDLIGVFDVEELKELCCRYGEEDGVYTDMDGTKIDESINGISIVGNIHDNPELLKRSININD